MIDRRLVQKSSLKTELIASLKSELAIAEQAFANTRAAATHEEAKPENDKDTRALEQSYLARGQAQRVEELRGAVADVETMQLRDANDGRPIGVGLVVDVSGDEKTASYFLAPHGGGARLASGAVQVVTPKSPLGRAFLGKTEGDETEVILAGKSRILSIDRVW
ncbi:MAG: transcription elongation factor GreAB [Polyangiaceae bacterium]